MMDNILDIQASSEPQSSYIKIIGVGGAGTNAVNHMYNNKITGVDFIVCNTDRQSLEHSPVQHKIQLGKGLGAGNVPSKAKRDAEAARDVIKQALSDNTHMLFIAAGMGGGTGTGASPVIASIAKEIELQGDTYEEGEKDEILVVAIVTIPFAFEGRKRREQAIAGIEELKQYVDSMIIVNTDKLKERGKMNMRASFALADDILLTAAKGVSEMMTAEDSYIHVDFRDVQSVMRNSGVALMGIGEGEGEDRAYKAIEAATTCDLLNNNDLTETKNVLMYIACSSDPELEINNEEIDVITDYVQSITNSDVNVIWGLGYDDKLEGKIAVTIVATGFESREIYSPIARGNSIVNPTPIESKPIVKETIVRDFDNNKTENIDITITTPLKEEKTQINTIQEKRTIGVLTPDGGITEYAQEKKTFVESTPLEPVLINNKQQEQLQQSNATCVEEKVIDIKSPAEPKKKMHLSDVTPMGNKALSDVDHWERIRIMRKLMTTPDGVRTLEGIHPTNDNIDEIFSAKSQTTDKLAFNDSGNLVKMENPALDGPVD